MKPASSVLLFSVLVNLLSLGVVVSGGFHHSPAEPADAEVLRVRKVEIVNSKGELCAVLSGYDETGGELKLLRPGMRVQEGKEPVFAYIGSPFKSLTTFFIQDALAGTTRAQITIEGQFPELSFSGTSSHGEFEMHAGRATVGDPVIKLRNGGLGVVFEK